jgi:hypothetical protein
MHWVLYKKLNKIKYLNNIRLAISVVPAKAGTQVVTRAAGADQ